MNNGTIYKWLYFASSALRILLPLIVFIFPLFVTIFVSFLDAIDIEFASRRVVTKSRYQQIDKLLDTWWYFLALLFSYIYLNQYFTFLLILFIYRIFGLLIFLISNNRKILFLTPNLFENVFFLFFFANYFHNLNYLIRGDTLYFSLSIAFLLKIFQEYWIHVAQISIPEDFFGKKRFWKK